jgi:hypothetical protein
MKLKVRKLIKGGLFFGLFGPPIGSVPLACIAINAIFHSSSRDSISVPSVILAFVLYSYLVGGIPAFVTGVIAGAVPDSHEWKRYCLAIGLVASVLVLLFGSAALFLLGVLKDVSYVRAFAFYAGPGFLSGTVMAALFRPWQPLRNT